MDEYVSIPPAPSPAFTPPDAKTGKARRSMRRDLLMQFLEGRRAGNMDGRLLWALFLARSTTPALEAYFDGLAESLR
jgi:hypothetical protein